MVAARSFTELSDECILTIHVKIEYGERIKLMNIEDKEYIEKHFKKVIIFLLILAIIPWG